MANYTTVNDLRDDALYRAGEPTDGSSSFATKVVEYLNRIQLDLLLGGKVAVGRDLATSAGIYAHLVDIPLTDWWWARKQPRGVFNTDPIYETGTATVTNGSTTLTFSTAPSASVAGWRIEIAGHATVPRISAHTGGSTSATLDAAWPEETLTAQSFVAYNLEYDLASDFLRFAGAPYVHSRYMDPIPVSVREVHDMAYPFGTFFREPPTAAALIQPQRIQLNAYDTQAYRIEYDYIYVPTDLAAGGTPILPRHHRPTLAIGAAMLVSYDKSDDRTETLASEFRERVAAMTQEHRRMMSSGSPTFGTHRTRAAQDSRKGRIQPRGEVYRI